MSCYFMVNIYLNHPDQRAAYDQYIKEVKRIVESYGGEYLVRTEALRTETVESRVIIADGI